MKIIIIGAGIAGITAGKLLKDRNVDFEILEASGVYGGRIKKIDDFADFPIDLGAEWIHKWILARPEPLKSILSNNDPQFKTFVEKPKTIFIWKNKKLRKSNWIKLLPNPIDLKFKESSWFDVLESMMDDEIKSKIKFNEVVCSIEYKSDKVIVSTKSKNKHKADKVLICVPLKILQNKAIKFDPPLPKYKEDAIQKEYIGNGLKVFFEFKEKFYPDVLVVGGYLKKFFNPLEECVYYNETLGKDSEKNIMGFFVQGKVADKYIKFKYEEGLIKYMIKELDEIFNGQASKFYSKHIVQHWGNEEFIQGSYSHRRSSVKKLSKPIENKIYFAGEAMNSKGRTIAVHGACESSYLAIEQILKAE